MAERMRLPGCTKSDAAVNPAFSQEHNEPFDIVVFFKIARHVRSGAQTGYGGKCRFAS
jgi:hypothetical protein